MRLHSLLPNSAADMAGMEWLVDEINGGTTGGTVEVGKK